MLKGDSLPGRIEHVINQEQNDALKDDTVFLGIVSQHLGHWKKTCSHFKYRVKHGSPVFKGLIVPNIILATLKLKHYRYGGADCKFDERISTPLCEIMGRNKSDKAETSRKKWHNYTIFYYQMFKAIQYNSLRIFELGLGTNNINIPSNMGVNGRPGASLYGWSEFFINSKIYGADIDTQILFKSDKIKTYYCDQTNPSIIKNMWDEQELQEPFDIIIDDGLHEFTANMCFFENSIHKLKENGFYIIEDIIHSKIPLFENKIKELKTTCPHLIFRLFQIPSQSNKYDNNLMVIKNAGTR